MGRVVGGWGVRGWVKIAPLSSDPAELVDHAGWWMRKSPTGDWREVKVLEAKPHGATLVAALEGVATREEAAALRGSEIAVPRGTLEKLRPGEMYVADLVGLAVVNRQGVSLGQVRVVQDYGAHPVLHVAADAGGTATDRLIPFVPAYVDGVDLDARRIDVDWPADY
jgi:16S rRNA processing protein RimM